MSSHPNTARALLPMFALLVFAGTRMLSADRSAATFVGAVTIVPTKAADVRVSAAASATSGPAATVASVPPTSAPSQPVVDATVTSPAATATPTAAPTAQIEAQPVAVPDRAWIDGIVHQQQTWNNCGPANISMLLQHYGETGTQREAARFLKPVREDKNVSPDEMVAYAQSLGYRARWIVGADLQLIKAFVANGLPVIAETWYIPHPNDEMGHYELVHGYDGDTLIVDDSYEGAGRRLDAVAWDELWRVFNRTLIVVWKPEQEALVQRLLGPLWDEATMHRRAFESARNDVELDPNDKFGWFNMGSGLLALGDAAGATTAFDKADSLKLPWRMLWYQHGIYQAHYEAGNYDQVIKLANRSLKATGDLEESYYWRGMALLAKGKKFDAKRDFSIAVKLNPNYIAAVDALKAL